MRIPLPLSKSPANKWKPDPLALNTETKAGHIFQEQETQAGKRGGSSEPRMKWSKPWITS
jgi:hypothetical protein